MCVCRRTPQPMALRTKDQRRIARVLDLPRGHGSEKSSRRNAEKNDEHYSERSPVHAKSIEPDRVGLATTLVGAVINSR